MHNQPVTYYQQHLQEGVLDFYGCFDGNTKGLVDFLRQHPAVKQLSLAYNQLDQHLGVPLLTALVADTTLASIDLYGNLLDDACVSALATALPKNEAIRELNLIDNEIGPQGCVALAVALRTNQHLATLNLYANKIGSQGCQALFEGLAANTTLKDINLGSNAVADAGGEAVRNYLRSMSGINTPDGDMQSRKLQRIDLSDNELTDSMKMALIAEARMQGVVIEI